MAVDSGFGSRGWEDLVVETQFATELTITGLTRLCTVSIGSWVNDGEISYSQRYALHVGLLSFTGGLERLAKIAILCHSLLTSNAFVSVKQYSHNISSLLEQVHQRASGEDIVPSTRTALPRPDEAVDARLIQFLKNFASGPGRYEHIDSLTSTRRQSDTAADWVSLALSADPVSDAVRRTTFVRDSAVSSWRRLIEEGGLDASIGGFLRPFEEAPLDERSTALVVRLYRIVRWVASVVSILTHQTDERLPILHDVVYRVSHPSDDFFQFEVAGIEDLEIALEELDE